MKKLLFVEDNAVAQSLIAEVFGDDQIDIAGDYVTAMEKLNQGQYDLVVTDIFFPQETGTGKKELAEGLAERLRSFCQEKAISTFLQKESTMISVVKEARERRFDNEYVISKMRWLARQIGSIPARLEIVLAGINSWLSSQDETDQPLGILIAEECEKRGLKFRMASSLFHHNDKLEAANQLVNSKQWPDIFDYGHEISSGEEIENPKEHRIFWEELRKEVMRRNA